MTIITRILIKHDFTPIVRWLGYETLIVLQHHYIMKILSDEV